MKIVVIAAIVLNTYSLAQSCVFDGKAMKSLGVSEVVNKETLSLFRCSEGHQMWLTDEELDTKTKKVVEIVKSEVKPETAPAAVEEKLDKAVLEDSTVLPAEIVSNEDNDKIVKTETVMKRESLGTNLSSSLSIEKFGLETLLFKKLESDRKFAKQLEDEKSELLHMMYTQKKLFERVNNNKFSFKNFNLFSKAKIYYIYLPIVLAYYIAT